MSWIDRLKDWFEPEPTNGALRATPVQRAAAALLAQIALEDGRLEPVELDRIISIVCRMFDLTKDAARTLVAGAVEQARRSVDLFQHVRTLAAELDPEDRIRLVEMMWEVVYADGRADDREMSVMRRLAGLLYVSDQDSGSARKRAVARLTAEREAEAAAETGAPQPFQGPWSSPAR